MKRFNLKYKIILILICGGVVLSLLFFSFKYNIDTTYILRDIFYFPINAITYNNKIELEDRCLELQEELNSLKNLVDINSTLSDFSIVSSVVINRNANYWSNELTINKGSSSNIKEGMAVIDGKGLIGRVEKVGINTSVVKLITSNSKENKISVKIWSKDNKSINKVLEVDNHNNLIISGINNDYSIEIGDKVTTSGLSDIYPSGVTIGEVEKIESDVYGISKKVYVKHISDLNNIRFVAVLIRG